MKWIHSYFLSLTDFKRTGKKPIVACLLAFILGIFGVHRFYLKRSKSGILFAAITILMIIFLTTPLILCWLLMVMLCFVEAIYYFYLTLKQIFFNFRVRNLNSSQTARGKKSKLVKETDQKSLLQIKKKNNVNGTPLIKENTERFKATSEGQRNAKKINHEIAKKDSVSKTNIIKIRKSPKQFTLDDEILDITDKDDVPIPQIQPEKINWINCLDIPYERAIMQNRQVKEETLRMYSTLCDTADKKLREEYSTLFERVHSVSREDSRYGNLLYTIYCVSEEHVKEGYGGKHEIYKESFSYQLLKNHLGVNITNELYKKGIELEASLSNPTPETRKDFHLNAFGLSIVWWDNSGGFRMTHDINDTDQLILNYTPARSTRIWTVSSVKSEIILLYLDLWKEIQQTFSKSIYKDHQASFQNLSYFVMSNYYGDTSFASALLKLCENEVRKVLPKLSYTKPLNIKKELDIINGFFPEKVAQSLFKILNTYSSKLTEQKMQNFIVELLEISQDDFKIVVEQFNETNEVHRWIDLFMIYKDREYYGDLLKILDTEVNNRNLKVLVLFEMGKMSYMQFSKQLDTYIPKNNQAKFQELVTRSEDLSLELVKEILNLQTNYRRVVLNQTELEKSQKNLEEMNHMVSDFLEETPEMIVEKQENVPETEREINQEMIFSEKNLVFVKKLLKRGSLDTSIVKQEALNEGKLLNVFIRDINNEFFEYINDQLIIVEDNQIIIDDFYINDVKELLRDGN